MGRTLLLRVRPIFFGAKVKRMTKKQRKLRITKVHELLESAGEMASMLGAEDEAFEFADAIIGVTWSPRTAVLYDSYKVLQDFRRINKWSWDDAQDWFDFNVVRGAAHQRNPPIFVDMV